MQTEIYGISDATGKLTGNYTDASGIRRGFTGDEIIEVPGALETFADFINASGGMVGSYVDAKGHFHPYIRTPGGRFVSLDLPGAALLEYFFVHGINDANTVVARTKRKNDVPGTLVGTFQEGLKQFTVPGSVSTEGYNINQDGSIVGSYETADGKRHGFIARLAEEVIDEPTAPDSLNYTFVSINVPGVNFLAVTASSDFEDYAGYTKNDDGTKEIAFTLIDGAFKTYDFPDSQKTHFYALGNNGTAAGHYQDSDGNFHGVVLEDGELRQYDFRDAVQTEIYGISDATGKLTGNFIDASGVRRGFTGDVIVEAPGATQTYADFINASGRLVGSYVDGEGVYHPYLGTPDGRFITLELPNAATFEFFLVHGINDVGTLVGRSKRIDDVVRTSVGSLQHGLQPLNVPGSISTEGWNINQDGSIVGHYDSADGRRHGFIAKPAAEQLSEHFSNVFNVTLTKGLNMVSLPLATPEPMTAKSLAGIAGATVVIALDADSQSFIAWTPNAPNNGFAIQGGQGYIVNVPQARDFAFVGGHWTNPRQPSAAAPIAKHETTVSETWAFVVSGHLNGTQKYDGYHITVRNLRTNTVMSTQVSDNYFAAATADLSQRSVVQVGDKIEVTVTDTTGNVASEKYVLTVTPDNLSNALLNVQLDSIGQPNKDQLLQNYPNPFNPETWIPYQLSVASPVSISIFDATGGLVRTLTVGYQSEGFYYNRGRASILGWQKRIR